MELSTHQMVARADVLKTFEQFTGNHFEPANYRLAGTANLSKKWKIVFLGGSVSGTRRAELLWSLLRDADGKWIPIQCPLPGGQGSTRLYISKDRNEKQKAGEIVSKKAVAVARALWPNLTWTVNKFDVQVEIEWVPCFNIEVSPEFKYTVQANPELVAEHNLDTEKFKEELAKSSGRRPRTNIQWVG
jgi:hypothetical protein